MSSSKSESSCSSEDDNEVRRGPWTLEEDTLLTQYISSNGEGRWNLLAQRSGLKRTGKSCRLRWLNYLKPDVKRGNLTPQEQLVILELHSKWGNRWSKIAQHLPGRTDNEIKNYWRTRIQKQARHLKIDTSSREFQEIIRRFWMPKLLQKVREAPSPSLSSASTMSIQNQIIPPLPLYSVPQYPQIIGTGQTQIPWQMKVPSRNESVQKSSCMPIFSPDSAANNVPKVSQILGFSDFSSFVYEYDDGNHAYDMDTCKVGTTVIMDEDHMGSNWVNNDVACSMWDLDELWQFNSL